MRYSLGRFQSLAVCLWTRLSQNRPSAHDVPSYLESPSVGHMALSLGSGPSAGSGPAAETKTPSSVAFIQKVFLPFFPPNLSVPQCKQSSTSSCTHLTPHPSDRAHSAGRGRGGNKRRSHVSAKLYTTMDFPPFLSPPVLCDLTPCGFYALWGAVDRAWEYLLFSCFCQQFRLKTTHNARRRVECKQRGGLASVCDGASSLCLICNRLDVWELLKGALN